ncbi:hypothetical protein NDI56_16570 [Haloarcula sp. S1CR25-12]|uniref:Glycerophosphoryl diester phosphodiesterase membrane domain-containing protein n=1 Tax=Haloarcula saliterrae TaxID=2950534 RepID=A0ABU2FGU0_9EURY|nr:hypothetical protein [Haloarcula sp. S1CR25-12]MDS0261016.1 hypothetical protein [Haloarcula sp. S1CR25-12]
MSLDIRRALQAGYDGLTSTAGYNVFSVLLVFYVAYDAVSQSFRQQLLATVPGIQPSPGFTPPFDIDMLAFELPLSVLVALTVAAVVSHEAVRFWAIQQFAESPAPTLQKRARVLLAVGGGVALFVYGVRQALLMFWYGPGFEMGIRSPLFVSVAVAPILLVTVYLRQEVALTAAGPTETVRNSLARFRKAPVPIFGLLLLLTVLALLTSLPSVLLSPLQVGATLWLLNELLSRVLFAALSTFTIATITEAYLQVCDGDPEAD